MIPRDAEGNQNRGLDDLGKAIKKGDIGQKEVRVPKEDNRQLNDLLKDGTKQTEELPLTDEDIVKALDILFKKTPYQGMRVQIESYTQLGALDNTNNLVAIFGNYPNGAWNVWLKLENGIWVAHASKVPQGGNLRG